jgi:PAS domain S-box-containing protein
MKKMKKQKIIPTLKEIKMKENDFIVSKTNEKGIITYCNEIFMKMAAYEESELLGKNHNIIRHPDMPRVAFKLAWDLISSGKEFFGFVKNLTKDGDYYWVFANITADYDSHGKTIGYTSVRRKPSQTAIDAVTPIYKEMIKLEQSGGMDASGKYLFDFLDSNGLTYDELILSLQGK